MYSIFVAKGQNPLLQTCKLNKKCLTFLKVFSFFLERGVQEPPPPLDPPLPLNHLSAPICYCPEWIGTSHWRYKEWADFGEWWERDCVHNIDSKISYDILNIYLYLYPTNFIIPNYLYPTIRQILLFGEIAQLPHKVWRTQFWAFPIIPGVIVDGALSLNIPYSSHWVKCSNSKQWNEDKQFHHLCQNAGVKTIYRFLPITMHAANFSQQSLTKCS